MSESGAPRGRPRGRPKGVVERDTECMEIPESVSQQLPKKKHEIFARFVAEGETYVAAYELAGFAPSTSNASTFANKPDIQARIAVLKKEKEERDLRFQVELRKANLDPDDPVRASREVAEWTAKQVLDLYWENARLAQMAGQFTTANDSLKMIATILGLLEPKTKTNDKPAPTQVGIAIYQDAVKQLGEGGGVSPVGEDNPLAPRISGPSRTSRNR